MSLVPTPGGLTVFDPKPILSNRTNIDYRVCKESQGEP